MFSLPDKCSARESAFLAAPPVGSLDAVYGATPLEPDEQRHLTDPSLVGASKAEVSRLEALGLEDALRSGDERAVHAHLYPPTGR